MNKTELQLAGEDSLSLTPPKGIKDVLPSEAKKWQLLKSVASSAFQAAGFREIVLPTIEYTELYQRGVGETSDVVRKEMYTFPDRLGRSLTLRPEGTAGVVRAYLNAGLDQQSQPAKLWYSGPMFRYESPQAGRQREFNQIGVEAIGSASPLIDVEVILLALEVLTRAGVKNFELQLNSIGCRACRGAYRDKLRETVQPVLDSLCEDCRDRFNKNPLRMLDCKNASCQCQFGSLPSMQDCLCPECRSQWNEVTTLLSAQGVAFSVNPRLVRGLDYYNRTVFEFVVNEPRLGAQSTILAGGRYDSLVETLGGPPTPAIGWALGVERISLLIEEQKEQAPLAFVVSIKAEAALSLATQLRKEGIRCEFDYSSSASAPRSFTKQIRQANKIGATWCLILGEDELATGEVSIKDMRTGVQERCALNKLTDRLLTSR